MGHAARGGQEGGQGQLALLLTGTVAGLAALALAPTIFPAAATDRSGGVCDRNRRLPGRVCHAQVVGDDPRVLLTFSVMTSPDQPVVTTGPYRIVRHPGYTGVVLVVLGVGAVSGNWIGLAGWTSLVTIPLLYRIRVEEIALVRAWVMPTAPTRRLTSASSARLVSVCHSAPDIGRLLTRTAVARRLRSLRRSLVHEHFIRELRDERRRRGPEHVRLAAQTAAGLTSADSGSGGSPLRRCRSRCCRRRSTRSARS